jgi:hypothetical protein
MVAFLTRMPYGIPGDITRQSQAKIEAQVLDASLPFAGYGLVGKIASGKFVPFAGAETDADDYGILVRPFPVTGANASDPLGTAVPQTTGIANVLRSGYINVKNNAGTPAVGGAVYVRVATAGTGKPIGGFEAVADGANTIALTGATFAGAADANGNVEVAYNI